MKLGNYHGLSKRTINEPLRTLLRFGGGILCVVVGVIVLFFAIQSIQTFIKEHSYLSTTALVETHEVVKGVDEYIISYSIHGEYYYHDHVVDLPEGLTEGSEFKIRYNPENPDEYTLNSGDFPWLFLLIGLLFFLFGIVIAVRNISGLKEKLGFLLKKPFSTRIASETESEEKSKDDEYPL